MKNFFLFLLIFLIGKTVVAQDVLDTPVEINVKRKSIKKTLEVIESTYPIFFSYGKLDLSRKKTIQFKGSLRKALFQIFEGENVTWVAIEDQVVLKYTRIKGQPIRGLILDADSQTPLIGANILVKNSPNLVGASTDLDGYFSIKNLIVGRYDLEIQYIGYETFFIDQVLVTSGKDVFLNINLKESILALEEVVIVAELQKDLTQPLNDMATVSARSFNIEQTQRFAASISDPARIAQSFAGVSGGGDDLSNDIIIRGNSTRGLLWMLEGVEIPNPNHFADYISNGGYVSMLNASMLTDSDFFTGAFPAQYGNALSGVFDLSLRNGNKDKRELSFSAGVLGFDFSTEGYFSKKSNASYLVHMRYSTLELLSRWLITEQGREIGYKDLNFKVNVPTKKAGQFSVFGIIGGSLENQSVENDSSKWEFVSDRITEVYDQQLFTVGLNHRYLLSDQSYLKSAFLVSNFKYKDLSQIVIPWANYLPVPFDITNFRNYGWTASIEYNLKKNNRNTFRIGSSLQSKKFDYKFEAPDTSNLSIEDIHPGFDTTLITYLDNTGGTEFLQGYFQWQNRFASDWEINAGIHLSYLLLNQTYGIDPRFGIKWEFRKNKKFALAAGMHSKPEQTSTLLISRDDLGQETPNKDLKMLKAFHLVGGYHHKMTTNLRFMVEVYYQHLFDIPVSSNPNNSFSILNGTNVFDIIFANDFGTSSLVSEGTGQNIGVDLTVEKFFADNYYLLLTSSIFDSDYTTLDGRKFNTRYSSNFLFNFLFGKEWLLRKQKKNVLSINGKFTYNGGNRYTPINLDASIQAGAQRNFPNKEFSEHVPAYIRFDIGISYKINNPNLTHSFLLDIQNILNRRNVSTRFYSQVDERIRDALQNGMIPFITYRLQFSGKEK